MPNKVTKEQLRQLIHDEITTVMQEDPQVVLSAMSQDPETMRKHLEGLGFSFTERDGLDPDDVMAAHRAAISEGRIDGGRGSHIRSRCRAEEWVDPRDGRKKKRYVYGEMEPVAEAWLRAFLSSDKRDERTGKSVRELYGELEKWAKPGRQSTDPFLGEPGEAGGSLVPTVVAAQIFEVMNERFVLKGLIQIFTSDAPLNIPRRIGEVVVERGGRVTRIGESKPETVHIKLSPERVGVITYIDPVLAAAAAVGPVQWVSEQIGEAMAKDDQRVIVIGEGPSAREPTGIGTLPTAGADEFDLAKQSDYDNTDRSSARQSMRVALFRIGQRHRMSPAFRWIANSDAIAELANHNDQDQRPWSDENDTYMRKPVVETEALVTADGASTVLGSDLNQYAWQEGLRGLRFDTTMVGGEAWPSDAIGVKAVQYVDGAPITPPTNVHVTDVEPFGSPAS